MAHFGDYYSCKFLVRELAQISSLGNPHRETTISFSSHRSTNNVNVIPLIDELQPSVDLKSLTYEAMSMCQLSSKDLGHFAGQCGGRLFALEIRSSYLQPSSVSQMPQPSLLQARRSRSFSAVGTIRTFGIRTWYVLFPLLDHLEQPGEASSSRLAQATKHNQTLLRVSCNLQYLSRCKWYRG